MYESGRRVWWDRLQQDVRYGLRQLRRNPGFTTVAVLTLALGIGANTAIFSVVNAVVLRPLPYPHSERLVWISEFIPALKADLTGGADYVDWKEQDKTLDQITAFDESASFNLTGRGTPARIHGARASASFFSTLGVEPQLGRGFTAEEDQPNGRKVVILMHAFWQQYFGSDPSVLGQTVTLDEAPYTVVGVMSASFKFPGAWDAQVLLPLQLNEASERLRVRQTRVSIIGRLKLGITVARAANSLDAIRKRAQSAAASAPMGPGSGNAAGLPPPGPGQNMMMRFVMPNAPAPAQAPRSGGPVPGRTVDETAGGPPVALTAPGPRAGGKSSPRALPESELRVVPFAEHLAGNLRPAMLTMLGVVGLVLLIACANVANLTLARASARTRELAVRTALGAGRGRLVRQLLTESVVLAMGGGVAGLLLAAWGVDVMTPFIPSSVGGGILSLVRPHVDATVLLFALTVSVVTGILFGLAPAVTATGPDLAERLKDGAQVTSAAGRGWLRGALAVAELSLALMVLIGAGLLIKSFYRVLSVDLGFAPEHVLTMDLNLTGSRYPMPEQKLAFFSEVLRRVESLPGVRSAALGDSLPLSP
ncbi:MAG TPA: ABC transporter permease, partial [Bryobacterales bacterium]|nr:ABC transporter permease [Bryobacterales bacterium]